MGFYAAATYAGVSIGPVLGGILTAAFGWRAVFVSMTLICLAALLCSCIFVPAKQQKSGSQVKLDWSGMACYIVALFLFLYGLSTIIDSRLGIALTIIGLALCVLFVFIELRTKAPIIDVRIFTRNKNFTLSNIAAMFNYAATFAVTYLMSIYLQEIKGMSAWAAGIFMVSQPIVQAVISPVSGRLSDRHSPYILASAGMAVCTAGMVCFALFRIDSSLILVMGTLLLTGAGMGLFSSPNQTAIMSSVDAENYSMASSLISTSRSIGSVFCMALIALVTSVQLGSQTFAQASKLQVMGSFRTGFIIFSVICAVGIFISLQRKGKKKE
jgi:MFS family permease